MRALHTAVSGLKANQLKMDVISNNIANVNTIGYKKTRLNFSEMMSQATKSAQSPSDFLGGTNGVSVGLGVQISSMNTMTTQGALQNTGRAVDAAIQGEGYFVVTDGVNNYYTRNGNFIVDGKGNLATADGFRVLGKLSDSNGNIASLYPLEPISVPLGESKPPLATSSIAIDNNLSANAQVGETATASLKIYDASGVSYQVSIDFIKTGNAGEWDAKFSFDEDNPIIKDWLTANVANYDTLSKDDKKIALAQANDALISSRDSKVFFDATGKLDINATRTANGVVAPKSLKTVSFTPNGGVPVNVDIDIASMTQYSGNSNVVCKGQDGSPPGTLKSVTFSGSGEILGIYSNGFTSILGSLATASFTNPEGLESAGSGYFSASQNSGNLLYSKPGDNGHGVLAVGYLELSNVDMSDELTDMMVTQRAYQMNSKTMLTVDEMLQQLMDLKR